MNTGDQKVLNFYRCWNSIVIIVVVPAAYLIGASQNDGPTLAKLVAISVGGALGSLIFAFIFNAAFGRWMPKEG